jgi:hypothetical protein
VEFVTPELPKLKGRDNLEDPYVNGKLIFCYINELGSECVNWIKPA